MRFLTFFGLMFICKCINQSVVSEHATSVSILLVIALILDVIDIGIKYWKIANKE